MKAKFKSSIRAACHSLGGAVCAGIVSRRNPLTPSLKTTLLILSLALAASASRADANITWNTDSYSAFDVTIDGTGVSWTGHPGAYSSITSPSGLWSVYWLNNGYYSTQFGRVELNITANAVFLGQLPSQYPEPPSGGSLWQIGGASLYPNANNNIDPFLPAAPISDGNSLQKGYLASGGYSNPDSPYPYLDWTGIINTTITSIPDLNDSSTWTWTTEIDASGTSLGIEPAPEPSVFGLLAVGMFGITLLCQRRGWSIGPVTKQIKK